MNLSEIVFKNAQEPKELFVSEKDHLKALILETDSVFKKIDKLLTVHQ